jgi:hypothetical protein
LALPFFLSAAGRNYLDRCCLARRADPQSSIGQLTRRLSIGRDELKPVKKIFIRLALGAMLLAPCSVAQAQQPKKVPQIGYLSADDPASESSRAEPIRLALRALGYIEGQNIAIEYRYADGKFDRAPELVAELVRLKVDIIVVAAGFGPIQAAKRFAFQFWAQQPGKP